MVLALTSAGICFLINALSFLAVLVALLAMRVPAQNNSRPAQDLLTGLREGFSYALGFAPIRSLLLLVAFVSLIGLAYAVLLPVFASDVLKGGADTYSFLMSAAGVGALSGAILLASRKTVVGLGRWITFMPATLGLAIIGLSLARTLLPALICVAVSGFAVMM